jgi:hypothetical protein
MSSTITREESTGSAGLWFGVLAAPLAWAAQLVINETFPEWFSCTRGFTQQGHFFGFSNNVLVAVVDGGALVVALLALLVSLASVRRFGRADPTPERRARWMANAGVINSVIFSLPIVLGFVAAALVHRCQLTP